MKKPQKKTIDGVEYTVTPLGAITGTDVLMALTKLLGPLMGNKSMEGLLSNLKTDDIKFLCTTFAETTSVTILAQGGKKVTVPLAGDFFDEHFAQKYMQMFEWLAFCVEVNYADFFGKAAAAIGSATAKLKGLSSTVQKEPDDVPAQE